MFLTCDTPKDNSKKEKKTEAKKNSIDDPKNSNEKEETIITENNDKKMEKQVKKQRKSVDDNDSSSESSSSWSPTTDWPPKWSCNQIRGKLSRMLASGVKISHWLKENDVNANSHRWYVYFF